ncbi:type 1 glutamine amidotransferase domain-containing protein [Terribacillus sp. DMT04]|uniref:type 1 glutamine amidotransferase domain-containing protein n=1 Tax=Terribacillus sp. DMT04 TaxID=2850441 RepID=UPI001C2C5F87|nr:type 1 glutamine amidotransferase domain-containing protein [Terribacillus sp. DMT04]QXE00262.1 type 1 glutamine amidotransferase [Terribacillus sp. DMT04]
MELSGKKILSFVSDDFEDLELWYPVLRLREAGAEVHLASETAETVYKGKYGVPATSDISFEDADPQQYDALLVPGGWSPDKLRRYDSVLEITRHFHTHKKAIGQICHAGWVLISADILDGVNVTSTPGIKDDMTNAGAIWHDEPVVVDGHIVSSRRPPDLPDYLRELIKVIQAQ